MKIRETRICDIPDVVLIFDSARKFFVQNGIPQWTEGLPDYRTVLDDIERGISRVVEQDGKIIATAAFLCEGEPTYGKIDGEWLTDGGYCVMHRFAVLPEYKGRGVAQYIMDCAADLARQNGFASIRIDTHESNVNMRRAIEKYGFTYCGIIRLADGAPRIAFEKNNMTF